MFNSLTSEQEQVISEVEKVLKKLYENGLVMVTENGNALFYTKGQYKDSVKIIEIFNQQKLIHDTQSKENIVKERINLKTCEPTHDFDADKLKITLSKIWNHIECNYDNEVERVIVIGTDAHFYISYPLNDSQKERLMDSFNIICGIDSYRDFALITLDI